MSEPTGKVPGVKTLGIRLPDGLHAQFVMVARLDGLSLQDACVRGVELYVEQKQSEPDFQARIQAALEEIEREADERRSAIQALFGPKAQAGGSSAAAKKTAPAIKRTGRRGNDA